MQISIWVEKYRPTSINDVIFQNDSQKKKFEKIVSNNLLPNLLLSGIQGTGKTTLSKVLVNEFNIDKADILKINCSDEKIDAMRNKVTRFSSSMPIGKIKVVRLEEIDYMSLDGQALLRALIEESSATCRFIATCNYLNKVIPPLRSRFEEVLFKEPNKENIALRMAYILETEKVEYEPEVLLSYVDLCYPDIRKTIQLLQGNSIDGKLIQFNNVAENGTDWKFDLLNCLSTKDLKKARKIVCENATREEHEDVYKFLYENINKLFTKSESKEKAILIIAEHLYKHAFLADTEIGLAATFIELQHIE